MKYEPSRNFKTLWPGMWCEWASIGIAEVLHERGLGEWTFVQASRPGETNGHAWLEFRDMDGNARYSIDATLHQFPEYDAPYVGPGRTPAAGEFTCVNFAGPWKDWEVITYTPQFVEFAEATVHQMS